MRAPVAAARAFPVLKIVMRADIAAGADVLPIAIQLKLVLGMLHDHQSHVMLGVVIYGIRVQKALVHGPRLSVPVIAAQSERRTRGQIVRQGFVLRDLQTVNQRRARFERQSAAAFQPDRGIGDVGRTACRIAADHDRGSLYRHAAALDPDAVASHGGGMPLIERSVFQRHAAAGDGQRDEAPEVRSRADAGRPLIPVQVNGKRAARDGDVFRHIPRQRHRAAAGRCRVDGCLQGGVHCPVVLRRLSYTADTSSVLPEGVLLISGSPATTIAACFVGQAVGVGVILHVMRFCRYRFPTDAIADVLTFILGSPRQDAVLLGPSVKAAQLAGLRVRTAVLGVRVLPLMLAALGDGNGGAVGVAGIARRVLVVRLDALHARSDFDSHCPSGIGAISDGICALAARLGRYRAAENVHRHGALVPVVGDRADTGAAKRAARRKWVGRARRCDNAAVDVQCSFIAVPGAVVINASVAGVGLTGADQRAGAAALCIDIQSCRLYILAVQGNALVQRHRHSVAEDQVNGAADLKRVIRCNVGIGGEPCISARQCVREARLRQQRAVCLCLHRAICVYIGKLVCEALRDGGIAHHAVVVFTVFGLATPRLEAIAVDQQGRRCAGGVVDAASVRHAGGIGAAGKGRRAVHDPQRVGAISADRAAADVQRSLIDIYALFSGERAAQNIRRAAVQKYRAVLVSNHGGARPAFIGRCDLNRNAALHRQGAAYMDRLTAVGLHDLTAVGALILNGQAAAVIDVKYSVQRDKVARPTGRLDRVSVQVQSNIASCQLDAVVIFFGERHILQQLHRGAHRRLCGGKRRLNVGVLRGRAVDGDLRHIALRLHGNIADCKRTHRHHGQRHCQ